MQNLFSNRKTLYYQYVIFANPAMSATKETRCAVFTDRRKTKAGIL